MLVAALKTKVKMNRVMKAGFLLSGISGVPVVFHSRNVKEFVNIRHQATQINNPFPISKTLGIPR